MKDVSGPSRARSMHPLGFAILAAWLLLAIALLLMDEPPKPLTFAFVMVGWLLSVMVHEFGHALVGYWAGDYTVKAKGYLDFDPRRYVNPGVSLVIPLLALALGGIGFPGGAVYLRLDLMRSRLWRSAASLAGPAATAATLLVLAILLTVWRSTNVGTELYPALSLLGFLQAMALVLNLLPIPGLDGFNAIRPFLPKAWGPALRQLDRLSLILLLLLVFGLPGASNELFRVAAQISVAAGLEPSAIDQGWRAFHFWQ